MEECSHFANDPRRDFENTEVDDLGLANWFDQFKRIQISSYEAIETTKLLAVKEGLHVSSNATRERNGTLTDSSQVSKESLKDTSQYGQNNGNKLNENGNNDASSGNSGHIPNGNAENASSFTSIGNVSTQSDLHGVPLAPSSLLGMATFIPPGQIAALHPFLMHQ